MSYHDYRGGGAGRDDRDGRDRKRSREEGPGDREWYGRDRDYYDCGDRGRERDRDYDTRERERERYDSRHRGGGGGYSRQGSMDRRNSDERGGYDRGGGGYDRGSGGYSRQGSIERSRDSGRDSGERGYERGLDRSYSIGSDRDRGDGYERDRGGGRHGRGGAGFERDRGGMPPRGGFGGGRGGGGGGFGGSGGTTLDEAAAMEKLSSMFKDIEIVATKAEQDNPDDLAARPNFGKAGKPVQVVANVFKFTRPPEDLVVYRYDVAITKVLREKKDEEKEEPREHRSKSRGRGQPPSQGPLPMPDKNRCHNIISKLAQIEKWPSHLWVYDGQKMLCTIDQFVDEERLAEGVLVELADKDLADRPGSKVRGTVTFKVNMKSTGALPIGPQLEEYMTTQGVSEVPRDSMQVLDTALKQKAVMEPNNRIVGRGIFSRDGCNKLSFGLESWHGYTQALQLSQDGLQLAMDAAVQAVPVVEPLIAWMEKELYGGGGGRGGGGGGRVSMSRELDLGQIDKLNRALQMGHLTIDTTHRPGKKEKVKEFTDLPASRCLFKLKEGNELSVVEFFRQRYNMKLEYPHLPCAVVGGKNWLPVEVCQVLPELRGLRADETTAILRAAAVGTQERQRKVIDALIKKAGLDKDRTAKAFGLDLAKHPPQLAKVEARVLPAPVLQYGKDRDGNPTHMDPGTNGDWQIMRVPMLKPASIKSYAIIWYGHSANMVDRFVQDLRTSLQEKEMILDTARPPPIIERHRYRTERETLQAAVDAAEKEHGHYPDILFIIQEHERQVYDIVKQIADVELGVQTQLFAANKLLGKGGMGRKLAGVTLKVNMKLGGDSWTLTGNPCDWCPVLKTAVPDNPNPTVMIMGADVSHGRTMESGGQRGVEYAAAQGRPVMPSIAAIVATTNLECSRYISRIKDQTPLTESVQHMEQAVVELLRIWYKRNGKTFPDVILMFRDGVSEGQFKQVLDDEFEAIKRACNKYRDPANPEQPYNPKVTFTTIQKKHIVRLFPERPGAGQGKSDNVWPGTVVEKQICHPKNFDFYLNSHAGIQGTNRPAKYTVLKDEVGFTADSMQLLSYWLCHTFCRCTRSVSLVPPAYYAHLASERGSLYLRKEDLPLDTCSMASGSSGDSAMYQWVFTPVHDRLKDEMFFI